MELVTNIAISLCFLLLVHSPKHKRPSGEPGDGERLRHGVDDTVVQDPVDLGRAPVNALRLVLDVEEVRPLGARAHLPPLGDHRDGVLGEAVQIPRAREGVAPVEVLDLPPTDLCGEGFGCADLGGDGFIAHSHGLVPPRQLGVPGKDDHEGDDEEDGVYRERDVDDEGHDSSARTHAHKDGPDAQGGVKREANADVDGQEDLEDGPNGEGDVAAAPVVRNGLVEEGVEREGQDPPDDDPDGRCDGADVRNDHVVKAAAGKHLDYRGDQADEQEEQDVEAVEEHELRYGAELGRDVLLDAVAEEGHAAGPVLGLGVCGNDGAGVAVVVVDAVVTIDVDANVGVVYVSFFSYCGHYLNCFEYV